MQWCVSGLVGGADVASWVQFGGGQGWLTRISSRVVCCGVRLRWGVSVL